MSYIRYLQYRPMALAGFIIPNELKAKTDEELAQLLIKNRENLEQRLNAKDHGISRVKTRNQTFIRFYREDIGHIETEINRRKQLTADAQTRAELEAKNKAIAHANAQRKAEHAAQEAQRTQAIAQENPSQWTQQEAQAKARAAEYAQQQAEKARLEKLKAEAVADITTNNPVAPAIQPQPIVSHTQPEKPIPPKKDFFNTKNILLAGGALLVVVYLIKRRNKVSVKDKVTRFK